MIGLDGYRVAVLATDDFEETELTEPVKALHNFGAQVSIISLKPGEIQAVRHDTKTIKVKVDRTIRHIRPEDYDALVIPGGAMNADALRDIPDVRTFVRAMSEAGKPLAVICHGPWLLVSAGLVRGRTLTGYHSIRDDVMNAGGHWLDQEVVEEGNWVTSRQPSDLPAFTRAMIALFSRCKVSGPIVSIAAGHAGS